MGARARLLLTMTGIDTVIISGAAFAYLDTAIPGASTMLQSHRTYRHISSM